MTNLTIPIAVKDAGEAKEQIGRAKHGGAQMLELRTDYLEELSVEAVKVLLGEAKKSDLPVIVTCRDKREGGEGDWDGEVRIEILVSAVEAGADIIDCEYRNFLQGENQTKIKSALEGNPAARLILSAHNFEGKFDDIKARYIEILKAFPAAIPKLVYTANHINDCFEAFDLLAGKKVDAIVFAMGQAGLISRIIAKKLDSFVTFASVDGANATAPGQITIDELKGLYHYDQINSETELYGIIGSPVGHSMGPAVHNACFDKAGLNKLYLPVHVDGGKAEFDEFMKNVIGREWLGFGGFSVTIPHKQNALEFIKEAGGYLEPLAERIGAVNTLIIDQSGKVSGYNTDYAGAMDAIRSSMGRELKGVSAAVIGAGGAARAIVAGLADAGAGVKIYNRTVAKGEKLAAEFGCAFAGLGDLTSLDAELVVNATSIGMSPNVDASPVAVECLKSGMVVFDTVYNPIETKLLRDAKRAGAKTIGGVAMFVGQAMAQFKLFTGQEGDAELMGETIFDCLSKQS